MAPLKCVACKLLAEKRAQLDSNLYSTLRHQPKGLRPLGLLARSKLMQWQPLDRDPNPDPVCQPACLARFAWLGFAGRVGGHYVLALQS